MGSKKADLFPRFVAALIDGVIGWVFVIIPVIGAIISVLYLLFKDGILHQITKQDQWKNKSIGKKIMNLEVKRLDGGVVDLAVSAKRNIPLAVGSFIAILPVIGWVIGPVVGLVFVIIELALVVNDAQGRRMGDRWGNTLVQEVEKVTSGPTVSG